MRRRRPLSAVRAPPPRTDCPNRCDLPSRWPRTALFVFPLSLPGGSHRPMDLTGKAALVTGTRRIGADVALALARRGVDVALAYAHFRAEADRAAESVR